MTGFSHASEQTLWCLIHSDNKMQSSRGTAEVAGSRVLGQDILDELFYWDKALGSKGKTTMS